MARTKQSIGWTKLASGKWKAPSSAKKKRKPKSHCSGRTAGDCTKKVGCRVVVIKKKQHCRPILSGSGQRQVCGNAKLDAKTVDEMLVYAHRYYTQKRGSGTPLSQMNKRDLCAFLLDYRNLNAVYLAKYKAQTVKPVGMLPVDIAIKK